MAFELKQHDRRPVFVVFLKDDFGEATEAAVDLTTATAAVFNMWDHTSHSVKISRSPGTITDAVNGGVTYNWGTADTNTAGTFDLECEITWGDGKAETFPGGPSGGDDSTSYWEVLITPDIA